MPTTLQVRAQKNPATTPGAPAGYRPEYRYTATGEDGFWRPIPVRPTDAIFLYRFSQVEALRRAEEYLRAQAPHQVKPAQVAA